MKTVVLLGVLAISGCAEIEQAQQENRMNAVLAEPSDNLCVVSLVRPGYREMALEELSRRGYTCNWPMAQARAQVWLSQQQSSDASTRALLQGYVNSANAQTDALNAQAAQQAQQNQPVNCYSRPSLGGVQTTCR